LGESRSQAIGTAIEVGHLPDILDVEEHHQHARQAEPEASVRRAAVLEAVQVVLDRLECQAFLLGLLREDFVPVLALGTRRHFKPLPEKVEALGGRRVVGVAHVVERTHGDGVVGHEHEVVAGLFFDVGAELALAFRIKVALGLGGEHVAALCEDRVRFLHRETREGQRGDAHFDAEVLEDGFAVLVLEGLEHELDPPLFELHDIVVGFDPRDFHVHAGELGVVAGRERRISAEHRPDLEDLVEARRHRHLLVELRRLGQVGFAAEVLDAEQLGTGLARTAHELGRVDLDEPFLGPELAHGVLRRRLDLEDQVVGGTAQVQEAPVEAQVQAGFFRDGEGRGSRVDDSEVVDGDLQAAEPDLLAGDYGAGHFHCGFCRQAGDEDTQGVFLLFAHGLDEASVVANDHELHLLLVAESLNPSFDADGAANGTFEGADQVAFHGTFLSRWDTGKSFATRHRTHSSTRTDAHRSDFRD